METNETLKLLDDKNLLDKISIIFLITGAIHLLKLKIYARI